MFRTVMCCRRAARTLDCINYSETRASSAPTDSGRCGCQTACRPRCSPITLVKKQPKPPQTECALSPSRKMRLFFSVSRANNFSILMTFMIYSRRQSAVDSDQNRVRFGGARAVWRLGRSPRKHNSPRLHVLEAQGQPGMVLHRMAPHLHYRYATGGFRPSRNALRAANVYLIALAETGWATEPDEKDSKYRLVIKDAQQQHSGTYTCASPKGTTNSITVIVTSKFFRLRANREQ